MIAVRFEIRIAANTSVWSGLGLVGVAVMLAIVKVCHAALDARIVAQWEHTKLLHTFTNNYFFT